MSNIKQSMDQHGLWCWHGINPGFWKTERIAIVMRGQQEHSPTISAKPSMNEYSFGRDSTVAAGTKHIVILGGGFAGVQAAIELKNHKGFAVSLVSDRDYLFLYPTSIWIPTRTRTFEQTKVDLKEVQRAYGFQLIVDTVQEIGSAENAVICSGIRLTYDYLIVAIGADKVMQKGQENTLSICGKPEISLTIRDRLDLLIAKGSGKIAIGFGGNPKDTSAVWEPNVTVSIAA